MIVTTPAAASLELNHELKAEARMWHARAREFAAEVVKPLGQVLDRMDARAAVAFGSPVYDYLAQAHREGYTRLRDSPQRGGIGLARAAEYLVLEELACADAGLAVLAIVAPQPFRWAGAVGFGRLARDLALPYFRGERLDWCGCHAAVDHAGLRATSAPGGWLLAGRTELVPGAAVATHAALACTTEAGAAERPALAIVPLDRPGVSRGPAPDQLGLRTQAQARLVFDGVPLSHDELFVPPRAGLGLVGLASTLDHVAKAIAAVGIGRAAYEGALRLAGEHVHEGRLLAEHGHVGRRLFRMFTLLEAARALTRAAHLAAGDGSALGDGPLQHATAAHAFATEVATEIVDGAMDLCSRRADARGVVEYLDGSTFDPEKLLRDVRSCTVARPCSSASPAPLAAAYP